MNSTINALIERACTQIDRLEADLLMADCLQCQRSYLYAYSEQLVESDLAQTFSQRVQLHHQGYPIAYILGVKEFWGLQFSVNESVLIPRADTELLVQKVLELPIPKQARVLEIGTGCGAIALALAGDSQYQITATDICTKALNCAQENATRLELEVVFIESDFFTNINNIYQCIVANPPYIDIEDNRVESQVRDHEPALALFSQDQGLYALKTIIEQASSYLAPQGYLALEHGQGQEVFVEEYLDHCGYNNIEHWQDLAGIERIVVAQYSL